MTSVAGYPALHSGACQAEILHLGLVSPTGGKVFEAGDTQHRRKLTQKRLSLLSGTGGKDQQQKEEPHSFHCTLLWKPELQSANMQLIWTHDIIHLSSLQWQLPLTKHISVFRAEWQNTETINLCISHMSWEDITPLSLGNLYPSIHPSTTHPFIIYSGTSNHPSTIHPSNQIFTHPSN